MTWSASQYRLFEVERTRPSRDLLAALPAVTVRRAVDVGCGPGNSTELVAARFGDAEVSGFDTSCDMIAAARQRLPHLRFEVLDVVSWLRTAGGVDLIFANAVLQWLPDHATLFRALAAALAPGGVLAVQMPDNLEQPAHQIMREIARDGPWAAKLKVAAAARPPLASAQWYHELLSAAGTSVEVWRTTYHHALPGGTADIVEWFKGSGLRPFLEPLDAVERRGYLARYAAALQRAYPPAAGGGVLLPFPRLFITASRGP